MLCSQIILYSLLKQIEFQIVGSKGWSEKRDTILTIADFYNGFSLPMGDLGVRVFYIARHNILPVLKVTSSKAWIPIIIYRILNRVLCKI